MVEATLNSVASAWFICPLDSCRGRGIVRPAVIGAPQVAGMIMVATGTAIALWRMFVRGG